MMVTTFFFRHGLTVENVEERIQGHQPGTLKMPESERYVAAIVPLLREAEIKVLVSSDLARAIRTRQILRRFLGYDDVEEVSLPLLRERGMGELEGQRWDELPPEVQAARGPHKQSLQPYGVEDDGALQRRVRSALQYLGASFGQRGVCCVTHADWLAQLFVVAGEAEALPTEWTSRSAIYRAVINERGQLQQLAPVLIEGDQEW